MGYKDAYFGTKAVSQGPDLSKLKLLLHGIDCGIDNGIDSIASVGFLPSEPSFIHVCQSTLLC
jgi:hypothetical protein